MATLFVRQRVAIGRNYNLELHVFHYDFVKKYQDGNVCLGKFSQDIPESNLTPDFF